MTAFSFEQFLPLAAALVCAGGVTGVLAGLFGVGGGAIIVPILYQTFVILGLPEENLLSYFAVSLNNLAVRLSDPFIKRITTGLPWVIAKWAQTIDGRVATRTGESKWISNPRSRMRVHRLRARVDAMLTGMGTILADDPMLNARDVRRVRRLARRVVVDSDLVIPPECALVETAAEIPTIVACDQDLSSSGITAPRRAMLRDKGVEIIGIRADERGGIDLTHMLERLHADFGVASVLVEAGPRLLGSLMRDDLIDEAVVYIAPLLFGDEMARSSIEGHIVGRLSSVPRFGLHRVARVGDDIEVTYRRRLD